MVHAKAFLMSYQVSGQLHINIKEAGSGLWYSVNNISSYPKGKRKQTTEL